MEIIKELVENIDDELDDAEKYIKLACDHKEDNKTLAELYFLLSNEELKHMNLLHDQVVKIISEYKKTNPVPETMQMLYDYLHKRQIERVTKIKVLQESYKE